MVIPTVTNRGHRKTSKASLETGKGQGGCGILPKEANTMLLETRSQRFRTLVDVVAPENQQLHEYDQLACGLKLRCKLKPL
jgi:hypothetical protein